MGKSEHERNAVFQQPGHVSIWYWHVPLVEFDNAQENGALVFNFAKTYRRLNMCSLGTSAALPCDGLCMSTVQIKGGRGKPPAESTDGNRDSWGSVTRQRSFHLSRQGVSKAQTYPIMPQCIAPVFRFKIRKKKMLTIISKIAKTRKSWT